MTRFPGAPPPPSPCTARKQAEQHDAESLQRRIDRIRLWRSGVVPRRIKVHIAGGENAASWDTNSSWRQTRSGRAHPPVETERPHHDFMPRPIRPASEYSSSSCFCSCSSCAIFRAFRRRRTFQLRDHDVIIFGKFAFRESIDDEQDYGCGQNQNSRLFR